MAASSSRRTSPPKPLLRSLSPSGRFYNAPPSSTAFASSTATFTATPPRVKIHAPPQNPTPSVWFSTRSISPNRSLSTSSSPQTAKRNATTTPKKTCMCSPTTHPGSFRCSLHKAKGFNDSRASASVTPYSQNRLNARRSAMTNSLVRIGGVEGELVKRALAALIRPSSHHQRRRNDFTPRPSRLSIMSKAEDLD